MNLLPEERWTVALPDIAAEDLRWIQLVREKHDPFYPTIDPHFTLVFGIHELPEDLYLGHIDSVARASGPLHFVCRYAMVGADDGGNTAYVFLVPDEGNAALSRLHDQLYRGPLTPFLRLQAPYIPHITLASMQDFGRAKALCDELDDGQICLPGRISALTPGVLQEGRFHPSRTCALGR
jgi:2'-5' RNA ligase